MKLLEGLFIDGFAGGGGASTGIAQAIGRDVDHAINHSETAIAIHKANHPGAEHHCTDIRIPMLPQTVTRGMPVAGAWFSPDCKEFSKAKGGPVKDRSIRALCWEVVAWLRDVRPERGYLENVEEFEYAAPLDEGGNPIKGQEGREFKRFVQAIRALGYRVQHKILRACDYGAPTSRKRLYMVMSRDKGPIFWPKPTHGRPDSPGVLSGKLLPYLTAASCIDWTIPCASIFGRVRELADATKRRIAHGVMRYVVNATQPFIVRTAHGDDGRHRTHSLEEPLGTQPACNEFSLVDVTIAPHITKFRNGSIGSDMQAPMPTVTANGEPVRPAGATPLGMVQASLVTYGQQGGRNRPVDEPHHTVTASKKDTNGVIGATMVQMGYGEREGQQPRALDIEKPLGTSVAGACKHAAVTAEMAYLDRQFSQSVGSAVDAPAPATTAGGGGKTGAVTAFLSSFYGSDKANGGGNIEQPLRTVRAGGQHHAVVAAHLEQANGGPRNKNSAGRSAERPLSTATTSGSQQRIVQTTMIANDDLPLEMMDRAVETAAFLVKYYATDSGNEVAQIQSVDRPLDTVTTKARFAVVTVTIDATTYVLVDIGLRMLKPRELARAQGFPDSYILNPIVRKFLRGKWVERPLTIAEQISAIGNSVCPPVARALVAANQPGLLEMRRAA
jgi:DNA (cytosine-5)-methyltransferase 1